jgi:hypothetical protein
VYWFINAADDLLQKGINLTAAVPRAELSAVGAAALAAAGCCCCLSVITI